MVRAGYAVITGRAEMASDMLGAEEGEEMEARDALEQADEVLAREREREQELLAEAAANSKNGTP
jgi:hypothetical protein